MDLRAFNKWYFNTVKTCFMVILACGVLIGFKSWYFPREIVRVSKKNSDSQLGTPLQGSQTSETQVTEITESTIPLNKTQMANGPDNF